MGFPACWYNAGLHMMMTVAWACMQVMVCRPVRRYLKEVQPGSSAVGTPGLISGEDIQEALLDSKPSAVLNAAKYQQFSKQYGQTAT